jgi:hypothetical protein
MGLIIKSKYKQNEIAHNPNDGLFYVIGHTGGKHWMPISDGFKTSEAANQWRKQQVRVDQIARGSVASCKFNALTSY